MAETQTTTPVESKEKAESSTSPMKPANKEDSLEGLNLLAQGKRNMMCGEIPQAVTQLQGACKLLAKEHGELADECGEAYLCYGSALLELSRMESGVLGNALEGIEDDDETNTSQGSQVEDPEKVSGSEDGTEEEEEEGGTEEEDEEDIESQEEGEAGTGEAGEGPSKEEDKEEEEVSNLQLAWEVLELAKVIYSKHEEKEKCLKTAEAYLRLGEVGLETEQYDQAVDDFQQCLTIQKKFLEPESRLIAETHYQIGLAACYCTKYDLSIEHLKLAVSTINAKIVSLEKVVESAEKDGKGKEAANADDPVTKAQKELKDLQAILPDILAKIEDTEEEQKNQDKVKELVKENVALDLGTTKIGFGEGSSDTKADASDAPVKSAIDVNHLVRKKRKPEEEPENDDDSSKKSRQEVVTNGTDSLPKDKAEKMEAESSAA